jgi:DNA polymerase I-like protein with 3'-5' exonuclease and polymerase domains
MNTYICDIEANGLLYDATKIHCLVMMNVDTKEIRVFDDTKYSIENGIKIVARSDVCVVFHNAMGYDIPLIEKLYNIKVKSKIIDTLILSRLNFISRNEHSIESYGEDFGIPKQHHEDWSVYSEEMKTRCIQDVKIGYKVFKKMDLNVPYEIEQEVQYILSKQEIYGWKVDIEKINKLHQRLLERKQELYKQLTENTPPVIVQGKEFIPKRDNKRLGYKANCPMTKIKIETFNPTSRQHIIYLLETKFKHKDFELTDKGNKKMDEKIISSLPYEELKPLKEYFQVNKILGFVVEGDNAWVKMIKDDGRIHHSCNGLGTITGRASHSNPNLGQTPSGKKPYGKECRELFIADKGKVLVGCDLSGLELRCLAHYLYPFDKGRYANLILEGDVHTENQKAANLPTRDDAKTMIYATLYGAGDTKIGSIVGGGKSEGRRIKENFLKNTPGFKKLLSKVKSASKKGFLYGITGRKILVRSEHAALNYLLQSLGAYIAKQWIITANKKLKEAGLKANQVAWIHDEIQMEVDIKDAELVAKILEKSSLEAGEILGIRIPIESESKIGLSWKDTH